ncbi:MAG: hypothetical protein HW374_718 [Bacteroidetes bacterium]|nr:hypothetical protein [Bacteroidota bacterium]
MVVLSACDSPPAGDKNADNDLVMLYARLLLLNEEYKTSLPTMTLDEFHRKSEEILAAQKTNKEEFIARVQAVSNDPESFRLFYDEVSKSIQELSKKQ